MMKEIRDVYVKKKRKRRVRERKREMSRGSSINLLHKWKKYDSQHSRISFLSLPPLQIFRQKAFECTTLFLKTIFQLITYLGMCSVFITRSLNVLLESEYSSNQERIKSTQIRQVGSSNFIISALRYGELLYVEICRC